MRLSFTKFKDRFWFAFEGASRRLAGAPDWVQDTSYSLVHGLLVALYYLPGTPLRRTSVAFSAVIGKGPPRKLHAAFSRQFALGLRRMETLRFGPHEKIDAALEIPEQARLDGLLQDGGIVLVMPHCQASVVMVRALASRYPTLMLIRSSANKKRAVSQWKYYENLGCDILDVRTTKDAEVARAVLKALRRGKIVVGVVDRVKQAPGIDAPINKVQDAVRTMAFGQPVGLAGWPARFAAKCKVPIVPAAVVQTADSLTLHIGESIVAGDMVETTQKWFDALEAFLRRYPSEWLFLYDKNWANVMRKNTEQAALANRTGG